MSKFIQSTSIFMIFPFLQALEGKKFFWVHILGGSRTSTPFPAYKNLILKHRSGYSIYKFGKLIRLGSIDLIEPTVYIDTIATNHYRHMYIKLRVEQSTSRTQSQWWCHQLLRIPFKATTQILWPKNLSMHSPVVSCFYYRQSTRRCTLGSTLELLGGAWHLVVKGSRRMHVAIW